MKVLLAGATGFIGSYILRDLLQEPSIEVLALCRDSSAFDLVSDVRDKVSWVNADIRDLPQLSEALQSVDAVVNATGVITHKPDLLDQVNIDGVANLINLSLHHKIKKFVHISSVAAMGAPRKGQITEADYWPSKEMKFNYGLSKYLGEQHVWRAGAEGMKIAIINPPLVLGAGRWGEFPALLPQIFNGLNRYPVGSTAVVDVRDVATMSVQVLLDDAIDNQRFICSAQNIELKELIMKIAKGLKVPPPTKALEGIAYRLGQIYLTLNNWMGTSVTHRQFVSYSQLPFSFDNTKSKEKLDFRYRLLDETIVDTCNAFLQSYANGAQSSTF